MTTGIVMSVTDELVEQLSALTCRDEGGAVLIHADQMRALLAERAEFRRLLLEQEQIMQSLRDSEWALIGERAELKRDAERLKWLISEQCIVESQNGMNSPAVYRLFWRHLGECQA